MFSLQSQKCEYCPLEKPYFNGQFCDSCPNNSYWDVSSFTCKNCRENE